VEVERRGLSGGVKLVRTLREELRQVEFDLSELKSATAACRAAVGLIETRVDAEHKKRIKAKHASTSTTTEQQQQQGKELQNGEAFPDESLAFESIHRATTTTTRAGPSAGVVSDRIASGKSEAIIMRYVRSNDNGLNQFPHHSITCLHPCHRSTRHLAMFAKYPPLDCCRTWNLKFHGMFPVASPILPPIVLPTLVPFPK
jgi:hypothetical protein